MEMYEENWIHHYDSQLFKNCMNSLAQKFLCVFLYQLAWLLCLLRERWPARRCSPQSRGSCTTWQEQELQSLIPATTKNNNWNKRNIKYPLPCRGSCTTFHCHLASKLFTTQPAGDNKNNTNSNVLNIICNKAHLQFSRARVGTGTETWLTG